MDINIADKKYDSGHTIIRIELEGEFIFGCSCTIRSLTIIWHRAIVSCKQKKRLDE